MERPTCRKEPACPHQPCATCLAIDEVFTYRSATIEQVVAMERIRAAAKELALAIKFNSPSCADTTAAIRKVREAVMTANAAICLGGIQI